MSEFEGERIAKVIARAGLCSRRDAERLIAEGRVKMNGKLLTSAATNVTAKDVIQVDNLPLPQKDETRLWRYHKPAGLVVSNHDPQGRPTVFEKLREQLPRVLSIGRLDINTEGLLLLTNDGELARFLELPATGWIRRYRVRAFGHVEEAALKKIEKGVEIEGVRYGPVEARIERVQGDNSWLTIAITEGKNREVKRICEHLGLQVNRLIRTAFGPFQLGELARGGIEEVPTRAMKASVGEKFFKKENDAHRRWKIQRP
ncbi:pseudouridine synthase [Aestuariivirga sp.]|uniref:pseudouridine synthase n=1 Tax=Aestuariivirga sp. TaxID=2650926 RepID=UPI003BACD528